MNSVLNIQALYKETAFGGLETKTTTKTKREHGNAKTKREHVNAKTKREHVNAKTKS